MTRADGPMIDGAVVVITGASSGIGRATARHLAEGGARLAIAARSDESLDETARECRDRGADVETVPTDVSDEADVEHLAARTLERFGRIDAWVNNAAVMSYGALVDVPSDTFRQVIETNLMGTVHGSRAALRTFDRQDRGVLVNIASLYAKLTSPYVSPYVASKYGILGLTRSLREEFADRDDIHVCAVLPEAVDTPIFEHAANYTGQELTALPPAMDPQRVVNAIAGAISRPKPEITVGVTGRLMAHGQRMLRRLSSARIYDRLATDAMQLVALRQEPADDSDGNVFEPQPARDRVDGGWRRQRRTARRLAAAGVTAAVAAPLIAWWWSRD